jgi:hypothetical protein
MTVSLQLSYSPFFMNFICRQTSDPRSGFATVEKDFPGGLTPMLGDKKVSQIHILFCTGMVRMIFKKYASRMFHCAVDTSC